MATIPSSLRTNLKVEMLCNTSLPVDTSGNFSFLGSSGLSWTTDNLGRADRAYTFDGTDSYIVDNNIARFASDFTIELDIQSPSSLGSEQRVYDTFRGSGSIQILVRFDSSSRLQIYMENSTGSDESFLTTPTVDTRYHIIIARSGTSCNVYINGRLHDTIATNANSYAQEAPAIGIRGSNLTDYEFTGKIFRYRVWNEQLDIQNAYQLYLGRVGCPE